MPIFVGRELFYEDLNIILLIQGSPGVGKSTLAQSATGPVLTLDLDNGMYRVNPAHRKDVSICKNFDELKADVAAAKGKYKTIVVDTGGALVEMLKQYVVDNPKDFKGGAKATGGISLQGYGFVKTLWNDFMSDLRKNFNVIIIFHESAERNGDDGTFYQIVVEGAARNSVYQSCSLAARLFISNGQRYLGFTPTEQYSAKSCFGISGLIPVPDLKDGDPNDLLDKLFKKAHENLAAETKALAPQTEVYEKAIAEGKTIVAAVNNPEDVPTAVKYIGDMPHALTSEKEVKAMLKKRLDELGIVWNKSTKAYERKS